MSRRILHVDMDAFYASVEQREHPEWKGRPLIVAGDSARRGVVAAASYEARAFGVRSAMPTSQALRLCPQAIRVPPRHALYSQVSRQIMEVFHAHTPLVEPLSLDESYLDVSELCQHRGVPAAQVAREIKARILEVTSLTASAGVAPNKFVAKVASGYRKPDGLTVVPPERVQAFLFPLPVSEMWGVGPVTAARLLELGLRTVGEVAAADPEILFGRLGRLGPELQALARGVDERPVVPHRDPVSLSAEETFAQDVQGLGGLEQVLEGQAAEVFGRLGKVRRWAFTVTLKLRYQDFSTVTRSLTVARPVASADDLAALGTRLLRERTEAASRPVRLIGLGVSGLCSWDAPRQLELFEFEEEVHGPRG